MNLAEDEPNLNYDTYDPKSLQDSIWILAFDHADDPSFSVNSKLVHSLFTRGRHSQYQH